MHMLHNKFSLYDKQTTLKIGSNQELMVEIQVTYNSNRVYVAIQPNPFIRYRYIASSLSKYAKLYENENGYVETNSQSIERAGCLILLYRCIQIAL